MNVRPKRFYRDWSRLWTKALGVTDEEVLGLEPAGQKKRGPQSQLEKQLAAIASLPRKEQQQLLVVVQAFVNQHAVRLPVSRFNKV